MCMCSNKILCITGFLFSAYLEAYAFGGQGALPMPRASAPAPKEEGR